MSQYYYTVAALPMLSYESDMIFTRDYYTAFFSEQLTRKDFMQLKKADIRSIELYRDDIPLIKNWKCWETNIRNELVRLRAASKGFAPDKYLKDDGGVFQLGDAAREAFNKQSPLESEDLLNRARWGHLDELETGHFFDLERIIIYYMKLQILERKKLFRRDEGLKCYNEIYKSISSSFFDMEEQRVDSL